MITENLTNDLAAQVRESDLSLLCQAEVILAMRTILVEADNKRPSKGRITVAAGTLNLYAPWVLEALFKADANLARLIEIGGRYDKRD